VLFLCTGNYFRSRYAERVFNDRAARAGLPWSAFSRGLAIGQANEGPLSPFARERLEERGLWSSRDREPRQLVPADLEAAHRIVALREDEHRPMIRLVFPDWESRIEYWDVGDVDVEDPDSALDRLEERVDTLVTDLTAGTTRDEQPR
jgi:protein-tyrosine phosphatase